MWPARLLTVSEKAFTLRSSHPLTSHPEKPMAHWEGEDYWDDANEPEPRRPVRRRQQEEKLQEPALPPRPLQEELPGSLYTIPDSDWGFEAAFRSWHPGACARCDLAASLAFCFKGTDARRLRARYTLLV